DRADETGVEPRALAEMVTPRGAGGGARGGENEGGAVDEGEAGDEHELHHVGRIREHPERLEAGGLDVEAGGQEVPVITIGEGEPGERRSGGGHQREREAAPRSRTAALPEGEAEEERNDKGGGVEAGRDREAAEGEGDRRSPGMVGGDAKIGDGERGEGREQGGQQRSLEAAEGPEKHEGGGGEESESDEERDGLTAQGKGERERGGEGAGEPEGLVDEDQPAREAVEGRDEEGVEGRGEGADTLAEVVGELAVIDEVLGVAKDGIGVVGLHAGEGATLEDGEDYYSNEEAALRRGRGRPHRGRLPLLDRASHDPRALSGRRRRIGSPACRIASSFAAWFPAGQRTRGRGRLAADAR